MAPSPQPAPLPTNGGRKNGSAPEPTATAAAETPTSPSRAVVAVGKLQVECPECGTFGLLDTRNLGKLFRCPACSTWCRTNSNGLLTRSAGPVESGPEVERRAAPGGESAKTAAAAGGPAGGKPNTTAAGTGAARPPARRRREGPLQFAAAWLAAAARTRVGRVALAGALLLALVSAAVAVSPYVFPSQLRTRGQLVARAWLRKDADEVRRYTVPAEEGNIPEWLERNPPPELGGQEPTVTVTVENDDGRTAELIVQLKATDKAGKPVHLVYRHRWVEKDGAWYFRPPTVVTTHAPAAAPAGRVGRGRRP